MQMTDAGFVKDTPLQIQTDITNEALASSVGFTSFPAELRQNLIDSMVIEEVKMQDAVAAIANGIGPDFANDQQFKQFGCSFGVTMKDFQYGQAMVRFTGAAGTLIPLDTQVSDGATIKLYVTIQSVVGTVGYVDVLCESKEELTDPILANTITTLVDTIPGVTSITNPLAGTSGIPAETIDEYKQAVYNRIQSPRYGSEDRARSLLHDVTGVVTRLIAFRVVNIEKVVLGNTIYHRGIECVVGGGDDYEVAAALYTAFLQTKNLLSDPSNSEAARTVSVDVTLYNSSAPVEYTRPKLSDIGLAVNIKISENLTTNAIAEGILQPVFEAYFNSLLVGTAVSVSALNNIIYDAFEEFGITTDKIGTITHTVTIDGSSASFTDGYLATAFDQYFALDTFSVTIS